VLWGYEISVLDVRAGKDSIPTCLELDGYKWSLTRESIASKSLGPV